DRQGARRFRFHVPAPRQFAPPSGWSTRGPLRSRATSRGLMGILRVLLALAVFCEHVAPPADFLRMWGGTLAVTIFFVTSGFYMELVLTRTYARPGVFWLNRAARIYPTYWIILLLALITSGDRYAAAFSYGTSTSILLVVANSLIFLQDVVVFLGVD